MIPDTKKKEFVLLQTGLTHIRTGEKVKQFECQGINKRGNRTSVVLTATKSNLDTALDLIPFEQGVKLARLENGESLLLERIGLYKTEDEKKDAQHEQRMENHARDRRDNQDDS